ncbi:conserved hypothetical protein [Vibrio rotiferianus]|nr:conserved hypothetical protein [Vibrio rotiferianus]
MKMHNRKLSDKWRLKDRKMQCILDDLIDELRVRCKETNLDMGWLVKESQKRLMKHKELHMHRAFIDGNELEVVFEGLSDKEKQVAALGEEALAMFISELDREL